MFFSYIVTNLDIIKDKLTGYIDKIISTNSPNAGSNKQLLVSFVHPISSCGINELIYKAQIKGDQFFYWGKPSEECSALGYGVLISFKESGLQRVELLESEIERWKNNFIHNWNEYDLPTIPLIMGGMKFTSGKNDPIWDDFKDSDWFIPKYIFIHYNSKTYLVYNFVLNADSKTDNVTDGLDEVYKLAALEENPELDNEVIPELTQIKELDEKDEWIVKVDSALEMIESGKFQKIVLSRRVKAILSDKPKLFLLLDSLSRNYPRCYIFAYSIGNSVFFGASPEKLAKISTGIVEADALAGSMPRGKTPAEDDKLAHELLNSKKNLAEQKTVVNFIAESFTEFAEDIQFSENPIIRKLPNIQHLWTPIKAKLKEGKNTFSILKGIHPTPAICGVPWNSALDSIIQMESHDRGLYAGITGWFNFFNEGEFAVSIRSALIRDNELYAFAGCGIVEGSDPLTEFEETELKLKPILSLFEDENIYQS